MMTHHLNRRQFLAFGATATAAAMIQNSFGAGSSKKPNIVMIFTDDHGYADLGVQHAVPDIKTPNIDAIARGGALATAGYSTAPQCVPSRAGLMSGQYQERFGVESNPLGPLPLNVPTLAERLGAAGYCCGHVGKWHLSPNRESKKWLGDSGYKTIQEAPEETLLSFQPCRRGFHEYFSGEKARYWANYSLDGQSLAEPKSILDERFRIDVQTDGALAFLKRNGSKPFFLYLAYYGPHVPLETPQNYLDRFPGPMAERRRHALGCISAIDDGVGKITEELKAQGVSDNTLVFIVSDNGAPLHHKLDAPLKENGWDGSLNDPWVGEKGMLSEGGIRVPFIVSWPGRIPPSVIKKPLSTLDVAATACELAGIPKPKELDGVNILPALTGRGTEALDRPLFWRWGTQAAVRLGKWKLIRISNGLELLFDLESDDQERKNLAPKEPAKCAELRKLLTAWVETLSPKGFATEKPNKGVAAWYQEYFGVKLDD